MLRYGAIAGIPKGLRKNNFSCFGAETLVWQGPRTAHAPQMERTSHVARRDGSTPKYGELFLREPSIDLECIEDLQFIFVKEVENDSP